MSWVESIVRYKIGYIVVTGSTLVPTFALVKDIISCDKEVYLVCEMLLTNCFNHRLHSYEVQHQSVSVIYFVLLEKLYDYHPLGLYHCDTLELVTLKYHIIECL